MHLRDACPPVQKDLLLVFSGCLFFFNVFPHVYAAAWFMWSNPLATSCIVTALVAVACQLINFDMVMEEFNSLL
jgi:hypothetical protein